MHRALSLLAAAAMLGACATETSTEGGYVEKQTRTGTHIPSKAANSDVKSVSGDELEKGRNSSMSPGPSMPMPRGGGGG
jgi:hypothetical protein